MDLISVASVKEAGLQSRLQTYRKALDHDGNEAQTRFHVIDEFLISELDWPKESIRIEPYIPGAGYADYALYQSLRCRCVLEAKRDEVELCSSSQDTLGVSQLSGSLFSGGRDGIEQAAKYASRTGAPIGIVTNGHQWIGFMAARSDGLAPADGLAVAFPSVEAIISNWSRFYEFFSATGLQEQRLASFLREREGAGSSAIAVQYFRALDRAYKEVPKGSDLAFALEEMFRKAFIKINTQSLDVLMDCFVETKDSRETDVSFEKIVDELVDRIVRRLEKLDSESPEALQELLESSIELRNGEFVLLVGNKGSGKTTFLHRFFRKVLPKQTREKLLVLSIDLLKGDGSEAKLSDWISFNLINQAEKALFAGNPTFDLLRGAFWSRYKRMREGELSHLYRSDPEAFRIKFGEELREFRQSRPREYLLSLLQNAIGGRGLLPALVIDNVDHYPRSYQDRVFQYAIGISSSVASFLVCPVTDTTVWSLSKAGPLQSFHSRAFFLPVPSLREVFAKRLEILKKEIAEQVGGSRMRAAVGRGMQLSIANLNSFCAAVEAVFVSTSDVTGIIGRLCNYDVRRCLELAGALLSSPWVGLEELIRLYVASGTISVKRTRFVKAMILLRASIFDEDKHSFVLNVFARPAGTIASPFMALYFLRHLALIDERASTTRDRFVSVSELWSHFSVLGVARETFRYFIDRLYSRQLIEAYDPSVQSLSDETLIRISPAGAAHYRMAISERVYISQMAIVTPLEREAIAIQLRQEARGEKPGWLKISRIFLDELLRVDEQLIRVGDEGVFPWVASVRKDVRAMRDLVAVRKALPAKTGAMSGAKKTPRK